MTTIVEISDNEDGDDCVINSVMYVEDDVPNSDFYNEVSKENKLLADFIGTCLRLENSEGMVQILKEGLLNRYYEADKSERESRKFQKNLRRANRLLQIEPRHKFSHIKDLCNILKALKVKKKVPFVTLTTNVTDKNHKSNGLKRSNLEQSEVNDNAKRAKYDCDNNSSFLENTDASFNDTCDTNDESMSMDICSQESNVTEEEKLLIPKKEVPVVLTSTEKRIKAIGNKIACYKQAIAILDLLEVNDDNINSPYLKSERLKTKIVSLHKERCELLGSQALKRKGIRLKLAEGHPPGPIKTLERFLNKNLNKDGVPPFPDFCDVVTCVTEANDKDNLGWSKAQIINEASSLFTLCGRALQKRRQNREYQDLVYKVKLEDLEKDPADEDPVLRAKLEENKRVAVKKESEILERFTMMQYLPSSSRKKPTTIENTENVNITEDTVKDGAKKEFIKNNNNSLERLISKPSAAESGNKLKNAVLNSSYKNDTNDISYSKSSVDKDEHQKSNSNSVLDDSRLQMNKEETALVSTPLDNVDTKIDAVRDCSPVKNGCNKITHNKSKSNNASHVIKPLSKVKHKDKINNGMPKIDNNIEKHALTNNENQVLKVKSIEGQVQQKGDEDVTGIFKKWKNNFIVTVEIINDS